MELMNENNGIANDNVSDTCLSTYMELYNNSIPLKDFKRVNNQTYKVLSLSNIDIRVTDRRECYKILVSPNLDKGIRHFISKCGNYFYMIPLQTPKGTIVGFILRSVYGRKYHTYSRKFTKYGKKVPFMFGFYKDFENYDNLKKPYPIVICEGLKDCILLKKMYPYVLSNNTSSLGSNIYVLRNITNKFILVYDNDETGYLNNKLDKKKLIELGCFVDVVKYDDVLGVKDLSDCIKDIRLLKSFKKRFISKIKYLLDN